MHQLRRQGRCAGSPIASAIPCLGRYHPVEGLADHKEIDGDFRRRLSCECGELSDRRGEVAPTGAWEGNVTGKVVENALQRRYGGGLRDGTHFHRFTSICWPLAVRAGQCRTGDDIREDSSSKV